MQSGDWAGCAGSTARTGARAARACVRRLPAGRGTAIVGLRPVGREAEASPCRNVRQPALLPGPYPTLCPRSESMELLFAQAPPPEPGGSTLAWILHSLLFVGSVVCFILVIIQMFQRGQTALGVVTLILGC